MTNQLNSIAKLAEALSKAQAVMSGAVKDKKNSYFNSSFADLSSIFEAIREPFASNGLSISQTMKVLDNGRTILKTLLLHSSGEYLESDMMLPDISDPQKFGGGITYYRRYSLMSIAGIPAKDDDGNEAMDAVKLEEYKKKQKSKEERLESQALKVEKLNKPVSKQSTNFIEEELKKHPVYQEKVLDQLDKENKSIADLTQQQANKIISKIDVLERELLDLESGEAFKS